MTMFRNVELTETLRAIMSRNTERNQTDYAADMQELLHGKHRHYLFMSYENGTLLFPEHGVYYRESLFHAQWLVRQEERPDFVRAFAVSVDRRMQGHVRGDICLLDYGDHAIDVEMNTVSIMDMRTDIREHLHDLHSARTNYKPIAVSGYLRALSNDYIARVCPYRAGFRRICQADAYELIKENILPVHLLSNWDNLKPLNQRDLQRAGDHDIFGIRMSDSADYDRWQRESLISFYEKQMEHRQRQRKEAR